MTHNTQTILEWSAPSVPHFQRGKTWYLFSGVIAIVLIAWGIITGSWSFAIVIILIAGIYTLIREVKPTLKTIRIQKSGVEFEGQFTAWQDCEGFWMIRTPTYTKLTIQRKDRTKGDIHILLKEDIHQDAIRNALNALQEQSDKEESLVDIFIRICKL